MSRGQDSVDEMIYGVIRGSVGMVDKPQSLCLARETSAIIILEEVALYFVMLCSPCTRRL